MADKPTTTEFGGAEKVDAPITKPVQVPAPKGSAPVAETPTFTDGQAIAFDPHYGQGGEYVIDAEGKRVKV